MPRDGSGRRRRSTCARRRQFPANRPYLDVADAAAYADVQEELARLDALDAQKAERLPDLDGRRLDVLTVSLASGIKAGDPRAILAAVRIMEPRAKLFGLDSNRDCRS